MRSRFFPYGIYFNIVLFLLVVMLSGIGIHVFRDTLLRNARITGMTLASNYASEERSNLAVYETLLSFGAAIIDARLEEGGSTHMVKWMKVFFDRIQTVLGKDVIIPYIVLDGELIDINGNPKEQANDVAFSEADWYKRAVARPGKSVFTGVYTDAMTGSPVITVARKCKVANAVLVFDIFPHNFQFNILPQVEKKYHSFFLCDGNGTILYKDTRHEYRDIALQRYVKSLLSKIKNGDFKKHTSYIIGLDGKKRAVYYSEMFNGWYIIVTVLVEDILKELNIILIIFILSSCVFLIVLLVYSRHFLHTKALMERINETVQVLGNSYYALYRVNFSKETYEAIKPSAFVRERLPQTGPYSSLLQVIVEVIEPDAQEEYLRNFSCESIRSLVSRQIRDFGGEFRRRFDDEYRWVSIRLLYDEKLTPEEVVLCFREEELEKQYQLQERRLLQDSLESAQRNEKAKQAFFRNMSHDMRTPVNAIIGLSELARRFLDDKEKVRDYLDKIAFSSRQLKSLIDDILNVSRMEQGKLAVNNREMDLKECLQQCLDTYQIQADMEKKKLRVSLDIERPRIMGDSVRIVQLLNNLLSNAFKFTEENDEIAVTVSRAGHSDDQDTVKYRIVVSDTGAGISKEFLPHLFEPYSREVRFSAKMVAGTGLGMSITKNLVEQMNGEIRVESLLGQGSTFTVILPFTVAEPDESIPEPSYAEESASNALQGKRVLLAEDNMVNRELFVEMLSLQGMEVHQACNGREALEQFEASKPFFFYAVLMDMQMPEMDGCEAAERIRSLDRPDAGSVPIIAVTANAFAEDIASSMAAGMNGHIAKPIDFKLLFHILSEIADNGEKGATRGAGNIHGKR